MDTTGEKNLDVLISAMHPEVNDGYYVFCTISEQQLEVSNVLMFFREQESVTIICRQAYADHKKFEYSITFAWITLQVHSSLEAVGLTAAFSNALAAHNISCNVIAGYYHDHIFVQSEKVNVAIDVLNNLAATKAAVLKDQI